MSMETKQKPSPGRCSTGERGIIFSCRSVHSVESPLHSYHSSNLPAGLPPPQARLPLSLPSPSPPAHSVALPPCRLLWLTGLTEHSSWDGLWLSTSVRQSHATVKTQAQAISGSLTIAEPSWMRRLLPKDFNKLFPRNEINFKCRQRRTLVLKTEKAHLIGMAKSHFISLLFA